MRTASPNNVVTVFGTIINAAQTTANAYSIALPNGVAASFLYQVTDPTTNRPGRNAKRALVRRNRTPYHISAPRYRIGP
jgi:hypothetical protein